MQDSIKAAVAQVAAAYFTNHQVPAEKIGSIVGLIASAFSGEAEAGEPPKPAVPIKKSIGADFIICLEDGKKLKMLKRYLRSKFGMSPDDYRRKWGLAGDYPMVAPAYAEQRSQFAKKIGLGKSVPAGGRGKR